MVACLREHKKKFRRKQKRPVTRITDRFPCTFSTREQLRLFEQPFSDLLRFGLADYLPQLSQPFP